MTTLFSLPKPFITGTTLRNGSKLQENETITEAMVLNGIMSSNSTTPNIGVFDMDHKKPITDKHIFHISFGHTKGYYKCNEHKERTSKLLQGRVYASFLLQGSKLQIAFGPNKVDREARNWFKEGDAVSIYMQTLEGDIIEVVDGWSRSNLYYPILTVGDAKHFGIILPPTAYGSIIPYRPTPAIQNITELQIGKSYYVDTTSSVSTRRCKFVGIFLERYWEEDENMKLNTVLIFKVERPLYLDKQINESVSYNTETNTIKIIIGDGFVIKPTETIADQTAIDPRYKRLVASALSRLPEDVEKYIEELPDEGSKEPPNKTRKKNGGGGKTRKNKKRKHRKK
jgi:hypothetical protein